TDVDGNTYTTVTIGEQCWMRENLKTTKLRDGTNITEWYSAFEEPAYMAHTDNEIYGAMYNGHAVVSNKLCPAGWYIPSEEDFMELINYLGGTDVAGEKLKATGLEYWNDSNNATNESGFTGLPAGVIYGEGITDVGNSATFWSSTEGQMGKNNKSEGHVTLNLQNSSTWADLYSGAYVEDGYSVRCLNGYGLPRLTNPVIVDIDIDKLNVSAQVIDDGGDPGNPITQRGLVLSTSPEPTTNDMVYTAEGDIGEFLANPTNLEPNTLYYIRAFATNGNGTKYSKEVMAKTYNQQITDVNNNTYFTTKIGGQHWMAQNLLASQFNDGTSISFFDGLDTPSITPYYTENPAQGADAIDFGYLYSHGVVFLQDKNICPVGWRVPIKEDWDQLIAELGGSGAAGGQMKSTKSGGNGLWETPNEGATNKSGFTAMPAGVHYLDWQGTFFFTDESMAAYFWSQTQSTEQVNDISYSLKLNSYDTNATLDSIYGTKPEGEEEALSIRCIEDNTFPVITEPAQGITDTSAYLNAYFEPVGEQTIDQVGFVWSTEPNPTNQDNVIISNTYTENIFSSELNGLQQNTTYHIRAFVTTTDDQIIYGNSINFKTYHDKISDIDGNEYLTTKIGEQEWLAENLRVTRFNNGDGVQSISLNNAQNQDGGYYIAENGYIYSYSIVSDKDRNICPLGWRLPSEEDWTNLFNELGGSNVAGGKMKAISPLWLEPNEGATNSSLFSALPYGYQGSSGYYYDEEERSYFWSTTDGEMRPEEDEYFKKYTQLQNSTADISIYDYGLGISQHGTEDGASIRCLKHTGTAVTHTTPVKGTTVSSTEANGLIFFDKDDNIEEVGFVWSTNPSPTLTSNEGTIAATLMEEEYSAELLGLSANTQYYVRAYAISTLYGEQYGDDVLFKTYYGTVVDADENIYNTVEINGLIWMAENLRTTKFTGGNTITQGTIGTDWDQITEPAYTIYTLNGGPNDNVNATEGIESIGQMMQDYGALYNWYAVEDNRICPTGWRVPTIIEVQQLINHLGGFEVAGTTLKSTSKVPDVHPRWFSPNLYATNNSGFNAIPAGSASWSAWGIGQRAYWWTSTEANEGSAHAWTLKSIDPSVDEHELLKEQGLSIRCVME
ncbi:MAG: fibrobacter succinogenes major paralogous domain-containing protein, partial [Perlabentimonas sp.]